MSDWIPIKEATIDCHKRYEVTCHDKSVIVIDGGKLCRSIGVAVREYNPEPYVPPVPKRKEFWISSGWNVYANPGEGEKTHVREVFPSDPSPDVLGVVIEEMKSSMYPGALRWLEMLTSSNV